jgi:NAD-dependent deacetylase
MQRGDLTDRLNDIINGSDNIVFFGGAGVSTESGIPDFRSAGGLYDAAQSQYRPEVMLSHSFFVSETAKFYTFYRKKMMYLDAKPNRAHEKLAELEAAGRLRAVITQNIDGLHQKAGSKNVIELHGSIYRNYCMDCGKAYDVSFIARSEGVPACGCGGIIKPDVVLYEESLKQADVARAITCIGEADALIIGGTSLVVYPAAGLVRHYKGTKLVIINKSETGSDGDALLTVREGIAEVMDRIIVKL